MTNPYRAMCAELLRSLENYPVQPSRDRDLCVRARALLDQPVAEEPTDEELLRLAREWNSGFESIELHFAADYARAVLARWGRPTPQPVAVSERLPRPEDCTAQGWCWVFYRGFATWTLEKPLGQDGKHTGYTHWLPANALPTPEAQ